MSLSEQIEEVFLEWQCGIDPQEDEVEYSGFDRPLMTVFVWREDSFDPVLIRTLENLLQHRVNPDILVSTLRSSGGSAA